MIKVANNDFRLGLMAGLNAVRVLQQPVSKTMLLRKATRILDELAKDYWGAREDVLKGYEVGGPQTGYADPVKYGELDAEKREEISAKFAELDDVEHDADIDVIDIKADSLGEQVISEAQMQMCEKIVNFT